MHIRVEEGRVYYNIGNKDVFSNMTLLLLVKALILFNRDKSAEEKEK